MATSTEAIVDVDRVTGELIQGWPRCKQSLLVILSTRLRTRVMRRWFGSNVMNLQDKPGNEFSFAYSLGRASAAIAKYEPEFSITSISIQGPIVNGEVTIIIEGTFLPDNTARKVSYSI